MDATKTVNARGMKYRWNFVHNELQVLHYGRESWDRSAFSPFLKQAILGEEITGHPSDVITAKQIAAEILPLVLGYYQEKS
jgi:hypothetical protein